MKVVTIIQARTTSSRLPNKVIMDIYGKSLLERVIDQAEKIKHTDEIWVATSDHESDDPIEILCERMGTKCHRGSLEDVRSRFYDIALNQKADLIVRITADNPFTAPEYADQLISYMKNYSGKYDYARMDRSTVLDGTNSEVFTIGSLEKSVEFYTDEQNREHVTPAIIQEMRMIELIPEDEDLISKIPYFVGVDTYSDLKRAVLLYKEYGDKNTLKHIIKNMSKNEKEV